ncbi:hypothetical protein [Sporosarcina sp. FSL K6-5500]
MTIDKSRHGLIGFENVINERLITNSYLNIQNENIEDTLVPSEF